MRKCFVVKFSETVYVSPWFFWPFFVLGPRMFRTHLVLVPHPCLGTGHFSREPQFLLAENDILNQDWLLGYHCSKTITLNRAGHIEYPSSWCSGLTSQNHLCPLPPWVLAPHASWLCPWTFSCLLNPWNFSSGWPFLCGHLSSHLELWYTEPSFLSRTLVSPYMGSASLQQTWMLSKQGLLIQPSLQVHVPLHKILPCCWLW